jgi:MerR family transcriptional regulator, light-induced transcriptional regulator
MTSPRIGIAAAAAASGVSAHTLRVWERRYGFPSPVRTTNGERLYSAEQVDKLTVLRRLLERGHRIAKIVDMPMEELRAVVGLAGSSSPERHLPIDFRDSLRSLSPQSLGAFRRLLQAAVIRQGLSRFILDTARPLIEMVGDWWAEGTLDVFQEHLFAEQMERVLRDAMAPLDPDGGPIIVLTTFPSEHHRLGLLMLEALLRLRGATCIPLGTEIPAAEIVKMCEMSRANAIALSFSAAYDDPGGRRALSLLRREVGAGVAIWAGGRGAKRAVRGVQGVTLLSELEEAVAASQTLLRR